MNRVIVVVLKAFIAMALLVGVFFQTVVIPVTAADEVALVPAYKAIQVPLVTAAIAFIACIQIALVSLWALLGLAAQRRFQDHRATLWSRVIVGSAATATAIVGVVFLYLTFTEIPNSGDGMNVIGLWLGSAAGTVCGVAVVLLLLLGQRLFVTAMAKQRDITEPI